MPWSTNLVGTNTGNLISGGCFQRKKAKRGVGDRSLGFSDQRGENRITFSKEEKRGGGVLTSWSGETGTVYSVGKKKKNVI